jgi:hypothetical protein
LFRLSTESPLTTLHVDDDNDDEHDMEQNQEVEQPSLLHAESRCRPPSISFARSHSQPQFRSRSSSSRPLRYTHHLPSQSAAIRFAQEEPSHFFESEVSPLN